jgi:hypothetical protein
MVDSNTPGVAGGGSTPNVLRPKRHPRRQSSSTGRVRAQGEKLFCTRPADQISPGTARHARIVDEAIARADLRNRNEGATRRIRQPDQIPARRRDRGSSLDRRHKIIFEPLDCSKFPVMMFYGESARGLLFPLAPPVFGPRFISVTAHSTVRAQCRFGSRPWR